MLVIQLLIVLIAVFLIAKTLSSFQKGKLDLKQTVLWIILWAVLLISTLLPQILGIPATLLGISRGIDVFIYLGIIMLFYFIFKIYTILDDQRITITKLIRELSILKAEVSENKSASAKQIKKKQNKKTKKTSKK